MSIAISDEGKACYSFDTCGQFHKHFTLVTYSLSKIKCTIHCVHFPIKCFQNALTYFAIAVSYGRKMLMKLPPGTDVIKLFTAISYEFRNKLECSWKILNPLNPCQAFQSLVHCLWLRPGAYHRVFVLGKPFQPKLMFAGNQGVYHIVDHTKGRYTDDSENCLAKANTSLLRRSVGDE